MLHRLVGESFLRQRPAETKGAAPEPSYREMLPKKERSGPRKKSPPQRQMKESGPRTPNRRKAKEKHPICPGFCPEWYWVPLWSSAEAPRNTKVPYICWVRARAGNGPEPTGRGPPKGFSTTKAKPRRTGRRGRRSKKKGRATGRQTQYRSKYKRFLYTTPVDPGSARLVMAYELKLKLRVAQLLGQGRLLGQI